MVRSVALVIRLGEASVVNREKLVSQILNDEKVRKALHEGFREQALKILSDEVKGVPAASASDQAGTLMTKVAKAASPAAETAVKAQQEWKDAERGLRELKCAFDKTPIGVFVDRNKGWLIFAGVVMGVGTAAVMYKTRTGDIPAAGLAKIGELTTKKIEIGSVSFDTKGLTFVPSKREIASTVGINLGDLDSVKDRFEISAAVDGGTLKELSMSNEVTVPLARDLKLSGKAGVGMKDGGPRYNLNLGMKYKHEGVSLEINAYVKGGSGETYGAEAKAGYYTPLDKTLGKGSYATVGAVGKVESTRAAGASSFQTEGTVTMGVGVTF
jgi:hypothetical protein